MTRLKKTPRSASVASITAAVDAETPRRVRVHCVCPDVAQTAMFTEGHTHDSLGSRIAHSGGRILSVEEVAREAVALVGSRRVGRSVPSHRGAMTREVMLSPSLSRRVVGLVAARGKPDDRPQGRLRCSSCHPSSAPTR